MAKSSTYLLRLDPQKKALWESKSREQDMSLAKWIEMMCDRGGEDCELVLSEEADALRANAVPVDFAPTKAVEGVAEKPHVFYQRGTLLAHDDSKCWCKKG